MADLLDSDPTSSEASGVRRLARYGLALFAAALLLLFLLGYRNAVLLPRAMEYGEPYIVSATWRMGQGGGLYSPVDELPFLHNNYNPLVQTLLAPVMVATGPSYAPLRVLAGASTLLVLAVLLLAVWKERRSLGAAGLAAVLPLASGLIYPFGLNARVDPFAVAFAVAGAAWAFAHRDGPERRRWWFLVFAVIAFAAKQSVVGSTGGVLLYALLRGRVREAFAQGAVFAAACGGVMLLSNLLSDGQYWLHAVEYNAGHDRRDISLDFLDKLLAEGWRAPLLLLLSALAPAMGRRDLPWLCWLAACLPVGLWTVTKSGSHFHYFMEAVCAGSVLAACAAHRVLGGGVSRRRMMVGLALLAAAGAWLLPRAFSASPLDFPCLWPMLAAAAVGAAVLLFTWLRSARSRAGRPPLVELAALCAVVAALPGTHYDWQKVKSYEAAAAAPDPVPAEVRRRISASEDAPLMLVKLGTITVESGRAAICDMMDFVRLQDMGKVDPGKTLVPLVEARRFPVIGIPTEEPRQRESDPAALRGFLPAVERHYRLLAETEAARFFVPRED